MKKYILISTIMFVYVISMSAQPNMDASIKKVERMPDSPITCSPNPVRDQLTIHFDNNTEQNLEWEICDLLGRIIKHGTYPAFEQAIQVDTESLHKGMYLLTVTTPNGKAPNAVKFAFYN